MFYNINIDLDQNLLRKYFLPTPMNKMTVEILECITEAEVALRKYFTYVVWCFGMSLLATGTEVAIPACV